MTPYTGSIPVLTTKKIIMELLTKKDYDKYIKVVNQNIKETERRMETLDMLRKVSQLSFEDWVKFQNKELTIK
jgi:hypothetical protein